VVRLLLILLIAGCSLYPGKKEFFIWEFREPQEAGYYSMNCEWERVEWETGFPDNMYLNCISNKI